MVAGRCNIALAAHLIGVLLLTLVTGCGQIGTTNVQDIPFTKEGELSFVSKASAQQIARIDIEIADTPRERAQGLMYRRSLPAAAGMLFVFDSCQPRIFWMKNTFISLDLVFVDDAKAIVHIEKNAIPLSEAMISSQKAAMYVVEVNAGFCDMHGIVEGDRIDFVRSHS